MTIFTSLASPIRHPTSWLTDESCSHWNARRDIPVDVWNPAPHSSAVSDRRCRLPRPFREIVVFARQQMARFDDCADHTADVHRSFGHQHASFCGCTAPRSSHSSFTRLGLVQAEVRRQRSHPGRRTAALILDQGELPTNETLGPSSERWDCADSPRVFFSNLVTRRSLFYRNLP